MPIQVKAYSGYQLKCEETTKEKHNMSPDRLCGVTQASGKLGSKIYLDHVFFAKKI